MKPEIVSIGGIFLAAISHKKLLGVTYIKKILFNRRCNEPCWNDHLVNYFPLMYRYEVNTNILHLTISRAEF